MTIAAVTQDAVEVATAPAAAAGVSQALVETLTPQTMPVAISQDAIETLTGPAAAAGISQALVEVLSGAAPVAAGGFYIWGPI